jgi:lysophospholipase
MHQTLPLRDLTCVRTWRRVERMLALAATLLCVSTLTHSAEFSLLNEGLVRTSPYAFVDDKVLAEIKDWREIQKRLLPLADITVSHFNGTPYGAMPIKIHFRVYQNKKETRGGIVISSGRTEGVPLYQELIYDLLKNGYSVYIHDHRGQGFSSRLITGNAGYVDDFNHYVTDLGTFVGMVQDMRPAGSLPLFLLAHSMGGAIAALHLGSGHKTPFIAAALVTPMMMPWSNSSPTAGWKEKAAQGYCYIAQPIDETSKSNEVVEGDADFDVMATIGRAVIGPNGLTHSRSRYQHNWDAREGLCELDQQAHCGSPSAKVSGITARWFNQACVASRHARNTASEAIKVPVLLLQGGEDRVVFPNAQWDFCETMNKAGHATCTGVLLPRSEHATFIEEDAIRKPALAAVLSHFECAASGGKGCRKVVK